MYTHQHGGEWVYILNDSTPAILVAGVETLDKLVDNLARMLRLIHRVALFYSVMRS